MLRDTSERIIIAIKLLNERERERKRERKRKRKKERSEKIENTRENKTTNARKQSRKERVERVRGDQDAVHKDGDAAKEIKKHEAIHQLELCGSLFQVCSEKLACDRLEGCILLVAFL